MNTIEVLRQALEALDELRELMDCVREGSYEPDSFTNQPAKTAITNLRAAIEQMEKAEPVAWMYTDRKGWKQANFEGTHDLYECTPLFAHPAPAVPSYKESKANCLRQAHGGID